jgi:hypothetical protein
VLFPVPGAPVQPIKYAAPVAGKSVASNFRAAGSRFSIAVIARERARTSPARIRAAQVSASTIADTALIGAAKKLPSDNEALNFARAFANGA